MSWTLYWYILREMLKLLVLATTVLVVLISVVAAVKPMSEGLLSGDSLLKFIGYTIPTMLIYALPFAGALASTLVFLRMASDNEVLACSACGLSYRAVLLPVVLLGLVLMMGLFFLSNFVLPHMFLSASRTVEADIMTRLVAQLNQNRPFDHFGGVILYADGAEQRPAPYIEGSSRQPNDLIQLHGVAVARPDREGVLRRDVTAERANVLLYRGEAAESWVTMRLLNVMYHDPYRGELAFTESYDVPPLRIPNPFLGRPKYYSWPRLRQVTRNPDTHQPVREQRRELAAALATAQLRQQLQATLGPGTDAHRLTLLGPRQDERYIFQAPAMAVEADSVLLLGEAGESATVTYQASHRADRRMEAQRVVLAVVPPETGIEPTVSATLRAVRIYDPRLPGEFTERAELPLPPLRWTQALTGRLMEGNYAWGLLREADQPRYDGAEMVGARADRLHRTLVSLGRSIVSRLHERAASAVACLLLALLGAVMSMKLRQQMPLVVYFWSFLLAILTLLLVNIGENIASSRGFPIYLGLALLWSGNLILATVIGWLYCQLERN